MKKLMPFIFALLFCTPAYAVNYCQDANIAGCWPMDGATTSGENDVSSNAANLSITAGDSIYRTPRAKVGNYARYFNHTTVVNPGNGGLHENSNLQRGDGGSTDINGANQKMSICYWIKPAFDYTFSSYHVTKGTDQYFMGFPGGGAGNLNIVFAVDDGSNEDTARGATDLNPGEWYYVCGVYNDTDIRVYVYDNQCSGGLDSNGSSNPKAHTGGISNTGASFAIGGFAGDSNSEMTGLMDDVIMLSRDLSAAETLDLCNNGMQGTETVYDTERYSTVYVDDDGGNLTECDGTTTDAYPGSGTMQACAYQSPMITTPLEGQNMSFKVVSGQTVLIEPGSYIYGCLTPGSNCLSEDLNVTVATGCSHSDSTICRGERIPGGYDADHPTRIMGSGWANCTNPDAYEIYGGGKSQWMLEVDGDYATKAGGSNIEFQCLEITDKAKCGNAVSTSPKNCSTSEYTASTGLYMEDGNNILLKNMNFHGLGYAGLRFGRLSNLTVEDTRFYANAGINVDWDIDTDTHSAVGANPTCASLEGCSKNTGNMRWIRAEISRAGCIEDNTTDDSLWQCYNQGSGGYADGIGGGETAGDWYFEDLIAHYNGQDALDLVYTRAYASEASVTVIRGDFRGNVGHDVKTAAPTIIESSLFVHNCRQADEPSGLWVSGSDRCRGSGGQVIGIPMDLARTVKIYNSTFWAEPDVIFSPGGDALFTSTGDCDGTELWEVRNCVLHGYTDQSGPDTTDVFYAYEEGVGANCGDGQAHEVLPQFHNNVLYNFKNSQAYQDICNGVGNNSGNVCGSSPQFVDFTYPSAFDLRITSGSPAINLADESISGDLVGGSADLNQFERGAAWDSGAFEFGSFAPSTDIPILRPGLKGARPAGVNFGSGS